MCLLGIYVSAIVTNKFERIFTSLCTSVLIMLVNYLVKYIHVFPKQYIFPEDSEEETGSVSAESTHSEGT